MTDADCFKAVRKLARANAKLLRQQRVLEADLIDAQLTILNCLLYTSPSPRD